MQRTFTKSPLWKSWSSSGVRSAIEEVEWTLKDKQDPTKGSKRFMVGRGQKLATCYKRGELISGYTPHVTILKADEDSKLEGYMAGPCDICIGTQHKNTTQKCMSSMYSIK